MNKKIYITPSIETMMVEAASMLAASNGFKFSPDEISGDVASNARLDDWDEED